MKLLGSFSLYTGWKNLIGSFICAALTVGFTTYIFGLFAVPFTEEFNLNRANYNAGMIVFMLGMIGMSPIVGPMLDRRSARWLLTLGGVCFGLSLMAISRLTDPKWMLVIIALPLSFAFATCGMICANTVTVRFFLRRRGRALGILALSTSVGGFVAQPATALLIEWLGWRNALFSIGLVSALTIVAFGLLLLRDRPSEGESGVTEEFSHSNTSDPTASNSEPNSERAWRKTELLCNRNFWLTAICVGMLFGIDQAVLVSQVPYFQDIGFNLTTAALLVSVKTISAIIGKLAIGYFADRVDLRWLFTYVAGCNALLMTIYILQPNLWVLLVAVAMLGVAVGGVFPVWTTIMAWLFGAKSYGTVMGFMSIVTQPFAIITLHFVGNSYDKTGSYFTAFSTFVGLALLAIALIWLLRPEHRPPKNEPGRIKSPINLNSTTSKA
ncbi:MFS transporter [Halioxenophilus sp. WMMB6]|uniref:MFS transporter n=1 Tax=Halioxenophilus sp. WMMB6 TaxID=3073815 RepID=UPI00295E3E32|nr:MFS transporter [Halioxenophilus sp. WMMB6]